MGKISERNRILIAGIAFAVVSLIVPRKFGIWVTLGAAVLTALALLILLREL